MVLAIIIAPECATLVSVNSTVKHLCLVPFLTTLALAQTAPSKPPAESKFVIPAGSDAATEIPYTIIRGPKPGPHLAVITGLSGTDYAPINALQLLIANLNTAELSGTLTVVHIANLPAFLARSLFLNPTDRKELTRSFPGKADGSQSERIAYALTSKVIDKADAVLVLEAGAGNTMLSPHVIQDTSSPAALAEKIRAMALSFGINYIVTAKGAADSPEAAALTRGKPVLKVMCGAQAATDKRTMDMIVKGVLGIMNQQGMIKDNAVKTRSVVYIDSLNRMESPRTGYLAIYVQRGDMVRRGDSIFGILSYDGKNPQIFNAPVNGIILSMFSTAPVNKGETVAIIGTPREP